MANLTAERISREFAGKLLRLIVADSNTVYAGAMVAISSGKAIPASTSAPAVGVAQNTAGQGEAVLVKAGAFAMDNDTTYALAAADTGAMAYVVDDHTVGDEGTAYAGRFLGLDENGQAIVAIGFEAAQAYAEAAALATGLAGKADKN